MDVLSDVLGSIRLTGGVFLDGQFTAPWAIRSQLTLEDCRHFLPEPAQVIGYHLVLEGDLQASVDGEPTIEADAGNIILIPRNEPHVLSSGHASRIIKSHDLTLNPDADGLLRIRHGGGGRATHIVCGYLASAHGFNPLIELLPRLMKVDTRVAASKDWIEASMRYAAAGRRGEQFASSSVIARLSELLLAEAVRQYSTTLPGEEAGWLRGAKDPQTGRALALMHRDLSAHWSEETLAKEVGMSRSAFVERFTRLVGTPPIRYLTVWRLQVARQTLRSSTKTIQQLADQVGYSSAESFSRAFRREFGSSPAQWRSNQSAALAR